MSDYTKDAIFTPERLEYVRMRPTAFFNSTGIEGLVHQALEIITNAIDEIALMPEQIGKVLILLCIDATNSTYQLVVKDNGRGLPIERLLDSYTKLHTSGKFKSGVGAAYEHSGGLFGQGAKASAGTSRHFKSISHRREESASIYVNEGRTCEVVEMTGIPPAQTGVTVLYEPDPIIFTTDITLFGEDGQAQLLTMIQKLCFFRKMQIEFRLHQTGLPKNIWEKKIPQIESIIDKYTEKSQIIFSENTFDRISWLRSYFGVQRPFSLQLTIGDNFLATSPADPSREIRIRYTVLIYTVKFDTIGGRFGMINNLAIDDMKSTHFITVIELVKILLSHHISNPAIRKFFLESYRIPLYLAIDIKYPGAQPSSTTKHAFISKEFRGIYEPSLRHQFELPDGVTFIKSLFEELSTDITSKYTDSIMGTVKVKNFDRLFERFPGLDEVYKPCSTTDKSKAELFLVEGKSAGGGAQGRDSKTQGVYMLGGKPRNAITTQDKVQQAAVEIKNDKVYERIIAIVGINPAKFEKSSLNYQKILIFSDGDAHGKHIVALLVTNLFALCPDIILSGMVYIVLPPLYSLEPINKKSKQPKVYLKDEYVLRDWLIENVFSAELDIGIRFKDSTQKKTNFLTGTSYNDFLRLVTDIGEVIKNISEELILETHIIEKLTYVVEHIEERNVNIDQIKQVIDVDQVSYNENGHILTLSIGRDDHIIPLQNVRERLLEMVIPLMNRIKWKTIQIYITTKNTKEYRDRAVSIVDLYNILEKLKEQFHVKRYKGIGSMPPVDAGVTCMDPDHREVVQVTSVGDVQRIFDLIGSDSTLRKKLL